LICFSVAATVLCRLLVKERLASLMCYFTNRNIKTAPAEVLTVSPFTGADPAFAQ
jgi:hypothetical protein